MNQIYVIQDKSGHVWAAAYEQEKAIEICRSCEEKEKVGSTYREVPFYKMDGTEIQVLAGPIDKKYLHQDK